jgi:response regulator RpfG family c-di-GMP phosphodiesterase
VIFISAASDIADKVKAFEEGGVDYITKPFQKEEVIARVKTQIALSHNIQRLKKASVALQKSEESLRLAQTIAELGHWEWDINSGEFVCSEEMHRILGIEASKGVSSYEAFLQAIHPDDREKVAIHLKNVPLSNPKWVMLHSEQPMRHDCTFIL